MLIADILDNIISYIHLNLTADSDHLNEYVALARWSQFDLLEKELATNSSIVCAHLPKFQWPNTHTRE